MVMTCLASLSLGTFADPMNTSVSLALKWKHQFQFAGYYAADKEGFYTDEGLTVHLIEEQPGKEALHAVQSGAAEYGVEASELLAARLRGAPLIALAVIFQQSPEIILTRFDHNIRTPQDLIGKTFMRSTGSDVIINDALFKRAGVNPATIRVVPQTWRLDELIRGEVDAATGYITDAPFRMRLAGVEPYIIRPTDYGIDFYGDTLFTTESELNRHPQRVAAMRRASLKGWSYALSHTEEMVAYIMELPGVRERGITPDMLRYEAAQMQQLIMPRYIEPGHMNPERWHAMAKIFQTAGLAPPDYCLADFIYAPNSPDQPSIWSSIALSTLALALLAALFSFLWIRQLRRAVDQRTNDLRQADTALKESELRYRTLFEKMPIALAYLSLDGLAKECNQRFTELFGYTLAEIASIEDWWPMAYPDPRYRQWVKKSWDRSVQMARKSDNDIEPAEYRITCKNGAVLPVECSGIIHNQFIVITFKDMSRQKETEAELRKSEARIRDLVESSSDWMWEINLSNALTYSNPAIEQILGYKPVELLGKCCLDLMHPEELPVIQNLLKKCKQQCQGWSNLIIRWKYKEGSWKLLESSAVPILNDEQQLTGFRGVDRDITERRQLEVQLNRAQKLESVGRLAGGVAHDFNNLLTGIMGYTDLALEKLESNPAVKGYLEAILSAAHRSADLTRQLLAFARKQTILPRPLDVNQTIDQLLQMLQRLLGEEIELRWIPSPQPMIVKMDPSQLDQVLANLMVNARDAINGVGTITIETSSITIPIHKTDPGIQPGDYMILAVSDNGCGMPPETIQQIFEPFFTTKEIGKGTGLGLATVYGIVHQNGGVIHVYSELNQGSTFRIYLPLQNTELISTPPPALCTTAPPFGHETILLVEDELAIRITARHNLERLGYNVIDASHPKEALQKAEAYKGSIDLLLTDVVMPNMNGRDLCTALLKQRPTIKVLFISGFTANVITDRGILEDHVEFLAKPFTIHLLASRVREVLDKKEPAEKEQKKGGQ
jgi:PAS domain S-box-containing protein